MKDYTKENGWVHEIVMACKQNPNSTDINGVALYHIIDLIRQDEREACAKECWVQMGLMPTQAWSVNPYEQCILAIQSRGEK
jgi:hypothetical protein